MITFDPYDSETIRARLARLMAERLGGDVSISVLQRYTVGFSWVTFGFDARGPGMEEGRALILRIGPPRGILAPYRAIPEFVTMRMLEGSGVPVPEALWADDSPEIFGAPWIISSRVEGTAPVPWTQDGGPAFPDGLRQRLAQQFLDALIALHQHDWTANADAAELSGSRDPATTAATEIDVWVDRMHEWSSRRWPMLEWAARRFRATAVPAPHITIVHGDYRIGNFLLADERITAILDWETVHLGNPAEDLGWIAMRAWRGKSPWLCHLFDRQELLDTYNARLGTAFTLRDLAWWEAFGNFKLAIMHLGAAHCFEDRGFNDLRMAGMGAQAPRVILQVARALEAVA